MPRRRHTAALGLRLPGELNDALERYAEDEGITVSAAARDLIRQALRDLWETVENPEGNAQAPDYLLSADELDPLGEEVAPHPDEPHDLADDH